MNIHQNINLQIRVENSSKRALIIANGFRLQYRVLRCAAAYFEDVFVLGAGEASSLRHSSQCTDYFPFPKSFSEMSDDEIITTINDVCDELAIDCIVPSCAVTTRFLAVHGNDLLAPHFPVPAQSVFDVLNDKWRFAGLCAELDVPIPKTKCFSSLEELAAAMSRGNLTFPLMIKPLGMWGSFGVSRIDAPSQFPNKCSFAPILTQEYIAGEDVCAFYICKNGVILASVCYLKTDKGVTFMIAPEIDRQAKNMIRFLDYDGVIGFDVRREPNGNIFFIECNPRFWYRMDLAFLAGLNFVELGWRDRNFVHTTIDRIEIRSPKHVLLGLLTPWRLSRYDKSFLKYMIGDPLPNMLVALQRILGKNKLAQGQQFVLPLIFFAN